METLVGKMRYEEIFEEKGVKYDYDALFNFECRVDGEKMHSVYVEFDTLDVAYENGKIVDLSNIEDIALYTIMDRLETVIRDKFYDGKLDAEIVKDYGD